MSEEHEKLIVPAEEDDPAVIDGEVLPADADEGPTVLSAGSNDDAPVLPPSYKEGGNQREWLTYVLLPLIFLTSALLGGLRISAGSGEFVFVRPALICLVFATLLLVLSFRAGLIDPGGWFSESIPTLKNIANSAVLAAVFGGSVQVFNSLIPEQGMPFWIVSFCFLWTLGVSYFNVAGAAQLVRTTVAMFVIAFLTKYFLLLNFTSESSGSWLQRLWDDPTREALTYLLDLPRYAPSTGYIQFFSVGLFLLGLFLLPRRTDG